MSYANVRLSTPVDSRIYRSLFGFLTAPLLLLVSAGALVAL
jgi:hypothetical protein